MYIEEKYEEIKKAVEELTELPKNWLHRNYEECVDARILLVAYLVQCHCTRREIMVATELKKSTVSKLINQYNQRISTDKRFKIMDNCLKNMLSKNCSQGG